MKTLLSLVMIATTVGSWQPVFAQQPPNPSAAWRLGGARSTTPVGPGRVKEVSGVLVSDSERKQIRFEADGRAMYVVPYERITAMHYEEARYPRRFLRRSSFYLTVHYSDVAGGPAFETIRLLSERNALAAVDTLERDTGGTFDRSLTTESFLGVPIRAVLGTRVVVTDDAGETTEGAITRLSASSLSLDESTGVLRLFDETAVQQIRLPYSPKHDALVGLGMGAGVGAFATVMAAGLAGCYNETSSNDDCRVLLSVAAASAVCGGLGALIGVTVGAIRYPFNTAFDVYRRGARGTTGSSAIALTPQVSQSRTAVLVSVRF